MSAEWFQGLRIGELAERVGCATSAVRYYERVGLLEPPRRESGQRRYELRAVERLELILQLRGAGLTISDLRVALDRTPGASDARRRGAAERAEQLRAQVKTISRALAILDHAAECTSTDTDDAACAADIRRRLAAAEI